MRALDALRVLVITDRRLVPLDQIPARIAAILAACPRGHVAIQIREKDLDGGPLLALARAVIAVARPAGALVFINDRLDVALAAEADGVHLPEAGLSIETARAVSAGVQRPLLVGCSRHSRAAVTAAATHGADLVQLGPIFETPGKGPAIGPGPLSAAHPGATFVAVGGIDSPSRAREAVRFGADAVAVIRAAWTSTDAPALIRDIAQSVE